MTWSRVALVALILGVMVGTVTQATAAPKVAVIEVKGMVCSA